MQEKPSTTFLSTTFLRLIPYVFVFHQSVLFIFFLLFLKNFQVILYILSAHYSLISIENDRYSLISKPHLDPLLLNGIQSNVRSK